MARRVIAIPLAVAIAIAVFSSFCFATGIVNDATGTYSIIVTAEFNALTNVDYGTQSAIFDGFNFGRDYLSIMEVNYTHNGSGADLAVGNVREISYVIDQSNRNTIYIAVRTASLNAGDIDYSGLSSYYRPQLNLTSNNTYRVYQENWFFTPDPYIFQTTTYFDISYNITYMCFQNVPKGTYTISDSNYPITNLDSLSGSQYKAYFLAGIYIDYFQDASSVVSDFESGDISYSDAISAIRDITDELISQATSTDEKIFITLQALYEIDYITNIQNNSSTSQIVDTFIPNLDNIIDGYISGSSSLDDTMQSLSSAYTEALSAAITPEQGILVNTTYQIKMQQFELEARRQAAAKVDSAISDDQLSEADEYYDSEEELISKFQVSEFESALDFELWFNTLPPAESTEYKKFFDYILNDSSIRMFLIIPISLVLVRIIFGTVLHLRVRHD